MKGLPELSRVSSVELKGPFVLAPEEGSPAYEKTTACETAASAAAPASERMRRLVMRNPTPGEPRALGRDTTTCLRPWTELRARAPAVSEKPEVASEASQPTSSLSGLWTVGVGP